jgi:hypothetical protein
MEHTHKENVDTDLQNAILGNIPINTSFAHNVYSALEQYRKDKGLPFIQDVIRLLCAGGLSKAGYLHNNS